MHFSTGYDWSISNMRINLWFCSEMKQWRWTLTDNTRPICKQESGQQPLLLDAMNDVDVFTVERINNGGSQQYIGAFVEDDVITELIVVERF